jgi:hypothetical protein
MATAIPTVSKEHPVVERAHQGPMDGLVGRLARLDTRRL